MKLYTRLMRPIISAVILCLTALPAAAQQVSPKIEEEHLAYDVIYQLGFLWKRAATATLTLQTKGGEHLAQLHAKTLPFADNIFKVRDTLVSRMRCDEHLSPLYFAKLSDENGTYRKDEVRYSYAGNSSTGNIRLYRPKRNAIEDYTLTEQGVVYDMLSIFYVIRSFDFNNMTAGQVFKTKIFSGKSVEYLDIEYQGKETIKENKKEYTTYKVRFQFYDKDKKKTSDKISAWIGADSRRIPIKLEGKLTLGSMKAVYTGD